MQLDSKNRSLPDDYTSETKGGDETVMRRILRVCAMLVRVSSRGTTSQVSAKNAISVCGRTSAPR